MFTQDVLSNLDAATAETLGEPASIRSRMAKLRRRFIPGGSKETRTT